MQQRRKEVASYFFPLIQAFSLEGGWLLAYALFEGVSELLICYPLKGEEKPQREMEGRYDYPSAALSILPRDRYR